MERVMKKILVIDDQEEVRELVAVALRSELFEVLKSASGRDGIQVAKNEHPDIILLDIMMPGFDGIATCRILKRNPITKNIPVIFLTAKSSKEDVKAAFEAGGKDYVAKPFSPDDLLKRIQKWISLEEAHFDPSSVIKKEELKSIDSQKIKEELKRESPAQINFARFGDVMVLTTPFDGIFMENFRLYRNAFTNIIDSGIFNVVFDLDSVRRIDGTGLALLLSVREALGQNSGGLRITFPAKELNSQFSFLNLNYIFRAYKNIQEAAESFIEPDKGKKESSDTRELNICLSCTFVNPHNFLYCGNCGTNLAIGRGDNIFESLRNSISQKVFSDAQSKDIDEINRLRNIAAEEQKIPSEFEVELISENLAVTYKSRQTDDKIFAAEEQIAVQAPVLNNRILPVLPGMKVVLRNRQVGKYSIFETVVKTVDTQKNMIVVRYTKEAKNIHTRKYFSINPKKPIPVKFVNPSLQGTGEQYNGIIVELSRVGMSVFSKEHLPVNKCLTLQFMLPDKDRITTPLVVAQRSERDFMYDVEFVVIDEGERSEIIQYMYKRQIEMGKEES